MSESIIGHFIHGQRSSGAASRTQDVLNPATGKAQAQVVFADEHDVEACLASSVQAQRTWAATSAQKRARVLMKWVELMYQNMDELARLLTLEHGKTFEDAKGDIIRGIEVVEFCFGAPHHLKGEYSTNVATGIDVYSMRQPLGVVAGITPFNFPAMIPLWKAGPALAAGNAFVLKPSERDPSVPLRLAELFIEAGGPAGVLNVLQGDKGVVDKLIQDPRVRAIGFVGSTPIAQYIYEECAKHGKRAQCFGGAKNHMLILPDADLDQVADALVGAAFGAAGERCMAISVAVPIGEDTKRGLEERLVARAKTLRVGHGLDPESDFGPLITAQARDRVVDLIQRGIDQGATLLLDGRESAPTQEVYEGESLAGGYFQGPSIFSDVTPEMDIYQEEIFGPVLSIVPAATFEEALRLPNEHAYGNGVSIFTRDGQAAREFAARVEVGMVGINVPIPVPIAFYTFGGWKASGFGDLNQHGADAFRFYTKTKTVTSRWPKQESAPEFTMPILD